MKKGINKIKKYFCIILSACMLITSSDIFAQNMTLPKVEDKPVVLHWFLENLYSKTGDVDPRHIEWQSKVFSNGDDVARKAIPGYRQAILDIADMMDEASVALAQIEKNIAEISEMNELVRLAQQYLPKKEAAIVPILDSSVTQRIRKLAGQINSYEDFVHIMMN